MIAFAIINYIKYDLTIKCVNSIFDTFDGNFKIYVLDNGSGNDSFSKLNDTFKDNKKIELHNSNENLGYAQGNNFLIKRAKNDGFENIIIANNDIIFHKFSIENMVKTLREEDCLIAAPKILELSGITQNSIKPFRLSFSEYWKTNSYYYNFLSKKEKAKFFAIPKRKAEIYWASGACFAVNLRQFEKIGFFDPYTFLYFEEFIISEKAFQKNMKIIFEPRATVTHHHGASSGGYANLFTRLENYKSEIYFLKNFFKTTKKQLNFIHFVRKVEVFYTFSKEKKFTEIKEYNRKSKLILKSKG